MSQRTIARRDLLVAPAAILGAPALLSAQARGDKLRVAFIGTGNRGTFLLRNMLKVEGVEVVAVCGHCPRESTKRRRPGGQSGGKAEVYVDLRKMLDERKDVDTVVLATPDWTHKDFDILILEMGKHLYAEKPLRRRRRIAALSSARPSVRKRHSRLGSSLRHDPARNASQKVHRERRLGQSTECAMACATAAKGCRAQPPGTTTAPSRATSLLTRASTSSTCSCGPLARTRCERSPRAASTCSRTSRRTHVNGRLQPHLRVPERRVRKLQPPLL